MSDVSLLVLMSLSDGPRHGYAIQQDISETAGVHLGPGSLYGAIGRLERDGLIEGLEETERRKPYRLTPKGVAELRTRIDSLRNLVRQVDTRLATS